MTDIEQLHTHIFHHKPNDQMVLVSKDNPHAFMCTCETFCDSLFDNHVAYTHTADPNLHCKHIEAVIDWKNEL